MFVYILDRNSTFLPKAYQHVSITFPFQSFLVSETEKKQFFPHYCFISSHGMFLLYSYCHLGRYQQSFYSGQVQCSYSLLSFLAENPYDLHRDTEKIRELLLKDSSDEEELFDLDEDEVDIVQDSDHNTETGRLH
jgi:hypothetical protein